MSLPSNQTEKVAIVTGSSTGIGFATSLALARNGFHTYATVRNLGKAKAIEDVAEEEGLPIEVMELDVDSDESVNNAISKIHEKKKRIDVAVNNAGYALVGPLEDLSMEEIRAQFETNLFGALRVMKAVLPTMRENRSGTIVNITSMGGRVAIPLDPAYHGSKFGLEGISESMRYETEPFGIRVIAIEPGNIKSNFWTNLKVGKKASSPDSPYAPRIRGLQKAAEKMSQDSLPPDEVAKVILAAVTSEKPLPRYTVGEDAAKTIEASKQMSDLDFQNIMRQRFFGQS
jgi:NAD(P)-dependent dehydrogenase (short-subunit alcohol dehydrogenase family)